MICLQRLDLFSCKAVPTKTLPDQKVGLHYIHVYHGQVIELTKMAEKIVGC